jgi:tetratricopeptide (TPR) repeat protein
VVAFFMFSRYRIQVMPALMPLAAIGALELAGRLRRQEWRRVLVAAAIVAAGGLFTLQTIDIFSRHNQQVIEMQLGKLAEMYLVAGEPDRAIDVLREGAEQCPLRCSHALERLAETYLATGRLAEGEAYFRRFTSAHPQQQMGWRALARILDAAGKHEEAGARGQKQ